MSRLLLGPLVEIILGMMMGVIAFAAAAQFVVTYMSHLDFGQKVLWILNLGFAIIITLNISLTQAQAVLAR